MNIFPVCADTGQVREGFRPFRMLKTFRDIDCVAAALPACAVSYRNERRPEPGDGRRRAHDDVERCVRFRRKHLKGQGQRFVLYEIGHFHAHASRRVHTLIEYIDSIAQ